MQGHRGDWHKDAHCYYAQQRHPRIFMRRGYDKCLLTVGAIEKEKESVSIN